MFVDIDLIDTAGRRRLPADARRRHRARLGLRTPDIEPTAWVIEAG